MADAALAQAQPLVLPATSGEVTGAVGGGANNEYLGYTIRETAGAAAHVILYDNASAASGTIIEVINLAAAGSAAVHLRRGDGVQCVNGIYAAITGAIQGSVFV